jgi:predicted phosphohydrolase
MGIVDYTCEQFERWRQIVYNVYMVSIASDISWNIIKKKK